MIRITSLLLAAVLATAAPAHAKDRKDTMPAAEVVRTADVSVGLNGLVCDFCATALNKVFRRDDAVQATHVDLDTKILSVVFQPGQTLSDERIETLVTRAGYTATSIERASDTPSGS